MVGLGTIVNMGAIAVGGIIGVLGKRVFKQNIQETLLKATACAVIFIGASGALAEMFVIEDGKLSTQGVLMMVISLAVGSVIGEILDIERACERFGDWLRRKTKSTGDEDFVGAFVAASLTFSIGAMAIVGSINEGLMGDSSVLLAKSLIDFISVTIMAASLGKGCIFAAIPVGILQGGITLLAGVVAPILTPQILSNLSLVGSILICCVGVNLIKKDAFRVANMLPAVVVAIIAALF